MILITTQNLRKIDWNSIRYIFSCCNLGIFVDITEETILAVGISFLYVLLTYTICIIFSSVHKNNSNKKISPDLLNCINWSTDSLILSPKKNVLSNSSPIVCCVEPPMQVSRDGIFSHKSPRWAAVKNQIHSLLTIPKHSMAYHTHLIALPYPIVSWAVQHKVGVATHFFARKIVL